MRILITGAVQWDCGQLKEIESMGHTVVFVQDEHIPLKEQGIDVSEIEGVICNGLFLYNDIFSFEKLWYIQLTSAGFDRIPLDYVKTHRIEIHNAGSVYSIPVAESVVSGVLQLYRKNRFFYENQKRHSWNKYRDIKELYGKKVCIIGTGSIGKECAKRFGAFGCHVTGINHTGKTCSSEGESLMKVCGTGELDGCLEESDIVIVALPLTAETRHLMEKERFSHMKQGSVFVNVARGEIVDTDALVPVLKTKLFGAVLDVFEEEPLEEDNPLWNLENVIITPHNSFAGEGNRGRLQKVIIANLQGRKKNDRTEKQ